MNVTAEALSPTSIEVIWDIPATVNTDTITNYIVVYNANVDFVSEANVTANVTRTELTGLEEFVTYNIRVQAVYNDTPGLFSQTVSATTESTG